MFLVVWKLVLRLFFFECLLKPMAALLKQLPSASQGRLRVENVYRSVFSSSALPAQARERNVISLGLFWRFVELIPIYCKNSHKTEFKFNFLLRIYILEGVSVVVLEILIRDGISDSKYLPSIQGCFFLCPDFLPAPSDCRKFRSGHSLATGCYVHTELMYAVCHLAFLLFFCWRSPRVVKTVEAAMAITGVCLWSCKVKERNAGLCVCAITAGCE